MSEKVWAGLAASMLLMGCVTTTTTTGGARPDADKDDAAQLNYELGARYYRNGNYELARERLLGSIEMNPNNAIAYSTLALTYEQLDNLRLATEAYEKAVRVDPGNYDVQNAYAVFLCREGRYEKARKHFDRAIKVPENDRSHVMMNNAGVCMTQIPDLELAEGYFRQALDRKSTYGEALLQMSLLKFTTEDYLSARAFLQRYLSSNMPTAGVLYLGIRIEQQLGDERARTDYANQILRDFPESPEARNILEAG
jgi:type IV pilus assembly protein PilF